ncbi:DMT family transporter [Natronobeatus ordinarius]|uniref:DMT family transporter n=1 Tax=Natronobeatus ordinarius TaxID=2963433 RepID=UPI0020CD7036|nr:DMT family transporter [Natronobeatus ordinarius]
MTFNRDILVFVALALVWGSSFAAIEVGLESLPPIFFAALRFDVAAALFAVAVVAFGYQWRPRTRTDWALIAIGGFLLIGAHFALLFVGQSYVSSAVAAIVLSLLPIVTPAFALLLLPRQRIRLPTVLGLLLGLAGVVLIALDGGSLDGQAIGVGLLALSAITFALGSVLTERLRGTLPVVSLQAWSMALGALVLHTLSAVHPAESLATVEVTLAAVGALAYLSVVATAAGFFVYFTLLERLGATELSLVNYAVPIVAALVGWALLGESLTLVTVAGFGLIVLGFTLCKLEAVWTLLAPIVRRRRDRRPTGTAERTRVVSDGGERQPRRSSSRPDAEGCYSPCDD